MDLSNIRNTALLLIDLQNDFIHPDGAYARGGAASEAIAALPERLAPVAEAFRRHGGWIVSTHFTLVPGRDGEPMISDHLRALRPFLGKGDFLPGGWGQALVYELAPADITVEKVAFSAFYMSRLEWVLRKAGIESPGCGGYRDQRRRRVHRAGRPCSGFPCHGAGRTAVLPSIRTSTVPTSMPCEASRISELATACCRRSRDHSAAVRGV